MRDSPHYWIQTSAPGRIAILSRPRGGDWLEDEVRSWACASVNIVVSLLSPDEVDAFDLSAEASICEENGLHFHSLPVPDRGTPDSPTASTDLAVALASGVRAGKNVGFHCRQGIGRSAMLAACVLIVLGETPEHAIEQISSARGLPVPETPDQRHWIVEFARRLSRPRTTSLPPMLPQASSVG